MTHKSMSVAAFLALAGTAALLPSTSTAAIIYADGDLLLGFRATGGQGGSTDYLVNLGSASSIVNSLAPITFSLGNIGADLSTLFGSWSTRADVLWSVSGVQKVAGNGFVNNTMFATRSDAVDGPLGTNTTTPWTRPSSFGAGAPAGKVQGLGQKYGLGTTGATAADQIESANASGALIQPTSQANSYASYQPGGVNTTGSTAFGYFADSSGIEGNFSQGAASSVLDLYTVAPGSGASLFAGNVTITNGAALTFTPASVPEPSAAVALTLGGMVLASLRRRRNAS